MQAERRAIRAENPVWNRAHNSKAPHSVELLALKLVNAGLPRCADVVTAYLRGSRDRFHSDTQAAKWAESTLDGFDLVVAEMRE